MLPAAVQCISSKKTVRKEENEWENCTCLALCRPLYHHRRVFFFFLHLSRFFAQYLTRAKLNIPLPLGTYYYNIYIPSSASAANARHLPLHSNYPKVIASVLDSHQFAAWIMPRAILPTRRRTHSWIASDRLTMLRSAFSCSARPLPHEMSFIKLI